MPWLSLWRPGDWLVALGATALCAVSFPLFWQGGRTDKAIIRRGGDVFAELDLSRNRQIEVPGPLGVTVVAVKNGRVRVLSDPGPRQ